MNKKLISSFGSLEVSRFEKLNVRSSYFWVWKFGVWILLGRGLLKFRVWGLRDSVQRLRVASCGTKIGRRKFLASGTDHGTTPVHSNNSGTCCADKRSAQERQQVSVLKIVFGGPSNSKAISWSKSFVLGCCCLEFWRLEFDWSFVVWSFGMWRFIVWSFVVSSSIEVLSFGVLSPGASSRGVSAFGVLSLGVWFFGFLSFGASSFVTFAVRLFWGYWAVDTQVTRLSP